MKKYYVMLLMAAALVACSKEQEVADPKETPSVEQNLVPMQFTASLEDAGTKTDLNTSTGAVSWAAGDAVKFVWELDGTPSSANSDALTAGDIDAGVATFTASVPASFAMTESAYKDAGGTSLHLYAVYPSTVVTDYSNASSLYLTVPDTQDGTFEHASIALAKWDKTNPSAALEFKNVCGLLQVVIADPDVRKIILHSEDYIAGKVNYSANSMKPVASGYSPNNDLKKDITVNVSGAGTYYIAVLPTTADPAIGVTNMYVSLYDSSDALVGDKTTTNELSISRAQIRKLGTVSKDDTTRLFVKVGGTGSGTSWGDAAGLATFKTTLTGNGTAKIYMAEGTYTITDVPDILAANTSSDYEIIGGFPDYDSGSSLAGRNIGSTIIDGGGSKRFFIQRAGSVSVDGLTIQNCWTGGSGGGAIYTANTGTVLICKNCTFTGSTTATGSGGAIYVGTGVTLNARNCKFYQNTVTAANHYAGAIYNAGTINLEKCVIEENSAEASGGAVFVATAGVAYFRDVHFINNTSTTKGGAIYGQGASAGGATVYCDGCYFAYTNSEKTGTGEIISMNHANTKWGINNSVFAGGWGGTAKQQILSLGNGVLVNSTLFEQCSSPNITNASGATLLVANCIVPNAASSGNGNSFTNNGTLTLDHTLYNKFSTGSATTDNGSLGGLQIHVAANTNFPVNNTATWYKTDATAMYSNNQTSTLAVSDCREYIHFYAWEGAIPEAITGASDFTKISLTSLSSTVSTANAAFATWLGDNLGKDIRGNARNASAMWPGSYEQTSGVASAPAFSVK